MADPQKNPDPNKLPKNNGENNGGIRNDNSYKENIVKAFADSKKDVKNYFVSSSKEDIIKAFEEYIREEHGDKILQELHDGKFGNSIDVTFNELSDKGFTIEDFLHKDKGEVVKKQFSNTPSETQAMKDGMLQFYKQRNALSDEVKKQLPMEQFLREVGQMANTDQNGKVTSIEMNPRSQSPSIASIKEERKKFVRRRTTDVALEDKYVAMMDFKHFDPTQKIACISIVRDIHNTIGKLDKKKRGDMTALWRSYFDNALDNPVSATTPWTTMDGLERSLELFFVDAAKSGLLTAEEFKALKEIKISPRLCLKYGRDSGDILPGVKEPAGHKFSELGRDMQDMVNAFAQVDLVTHVNETVNSLDTMLEDYNRLFAMPGTMLDFFKQFGTPDELSPYTKDPKYIALKEEYEGNKEALRSEALSIVERDALSQKTLILQKRLLIFEKPDYDTLKANQERIKDILGDEDLSDNDRQGYETQLKDIEYLMKKEANEKHGGTWEKYFDHIAQQVDTSADVLGNTKKLGSQVWAVLTNLKENNRDISQISPEGQNILMKASVDVQLMKVKKSDVANTIGYNFEEYRTFVSQLFDMTSMQSTIMTKDGEPIVLNFKSKKFTGRPYNRQTIDIKDINALKNIAIEFVLDITDNSNAESFMKVVTGGDRSHVIKNFFKKPGFPDTITDSSLVRVTGKDGQVYEGYLSPALFHDDGTDIPEYDEQEITANTFVLYDKPADQSHNDRKIVTQRESKDGKIIDKIDDESQKALPVYVNVANMDERSRIDIIHKHVTLSQKSINTLALGYAVAKETDKEDMFGPNSNLFESITKDMDEEDAENITSDHKDSEEGDIERVSESAGVLFEKEWNRLFPMMNTGTKEPIQCRDNLRLAVAPTTGKPEGVPPHTQFLSLTVQNIRPGIDGRVESCEFVMNNLTYGGRPTEPTKPMKINASNLNKFVSLVQPDNTINLGITTDYKSEVGTAGRYEEVRSKLEGLPHIKYNMEVFKGLEYNKKGGSDKRGGFYKKDDPKKVPITHFIATKATSKDDKSENYNVEYEVKYLDGDRYEITSSRYFEKVKDKDGKEKKEKELTRSKTTTDLAGIMLIIANKKLVPYTAAGKKEIENQGGKADLVPDIRRYRRSPGTIRKVLKENGEKMVHARQHKKDESGKEELNHLLVNEHNIYRRLAEKFGSTLEIFDMDFLDHMAEEEEGKTMDYGRKKIDHELKFLNSLHHSHNYGVRPTGSKGGRGASNFVEEYIEHAEHEFHDKGEKVSYKARYRVAASLLYMVEEYKNGYARGIGNYPRGTYVKLMFGSIAHQNFIARYNKKEAEIKNSKQGSQRQEELMLMEYNYIVNNLSGGPQQDPDWTWNIDPTGEKGQTSGYNPDAWHFQKLYSRKYGNELRGKVNSIKQIKTRKSDEYPAKCINLGDRDHTYRDYYKHLAEGRIEKAVGELVALQHLSNDPDQANECIMAIMAGMLSGMFTQALGNDTRDDLRRVCRTCYGCPFVSWMEHIDGPKKIQAMLNLATADKGKNSFAEFQYEYKSKDHHGHEKKNKKKYNRNDFHCLKREAGGPAGFVYAFKDWVKSGTDIRDRLASFLHLENLNDDDNNNMMYIWNEGVKNGKDVKVYGHDVTTQGKGYVAEIFEELYFNRDKGAPIEDYRWEANGFHTRTMIDAYARAMNKFDGSGSFENGIGDPAGMYWTTLYNNAPDPSIKLGADKKYKMAHYVDELFRTSRGVGDITYAEDQIEEFYKYIRLAKDQKNKKDRHRLIWFFITEKMYAKGPLPGVVEQTIAKYLSFFEHNLDLFDKEMAGMHRAPGEAGRSSKSERRTFGHVFTDSMHHTVYIPDSERKQKTPTERSKIYEDEIRNDKLIINGSMDEANQKTKGQGRGARYSQNSKIGKSIDEKIREMSKMESPYSGAKASNKKEIGGVKRAPKRDKKGELRETLAPNSRKKGKDERIERKISETFGGKNPKPTGYDDEEIKKKSKNIQEQTMKGVYDDFSPEAQKKLRQQLINDPTFRKELLKDPTLRKETIDDMSFAEVEDKARELHVT